MEVDEDAASSSGGTGTSLDVLDTDMNLDSPSPTKSDSPLLHKSVGYTQMMNEILEGLRLEVDDVALQDLQIICQRLSMDTELKTELISKQSLLEVYGVLLKHTNNDFRQIIQIMNEFVPKIIRDLDPELLQKMNWLNEMISKENECFGLAENSVMYGREDKLTELFNLMSFEKSKNVLLVNICGMTGIGKSFLVKHLGSRLICQGQHSVIYVDASGVTQLADLVAKILEHSNIDRFATGNVDELMGSLYDFLLQNEKNSYVLIIDDLSTLTSDSDIQLTNDLLSLLNELVKFTKKNKLKLKLLVTSQTHFKMTNEKTEVQELVAAKRLMADYTKDVSLDQLSSDATLKFLGPALKSFSGPDLKKIMKFCDGHPHSLHVIRSMASLDSSYTTEITTFTSTHAEELHSELVDYIFKKEFDRLGDWQRWILLAVALFDRDAQLGALHYIVNAAESKQNFYSQMKEKFSSGFWLTFRICDVKSQAHRKIVVNTQHSLIRTFLREKITSCLANKDGAEYKSFAVMRERYVIHHIDELIDIGRECVPPSPRSTNFIQKICARFMHNRANFRITLGLIQMLQNPHLLVSKGSSTARGYSDIVHLFVCLHQFHDFFNKRLVALFQELIHVTVNDPVQGVLLWTLYIMVLVLEQSWEPLQFVMKQCMEGNNPNLIEETFPNLYSFCKAIHGYATGSLYTFWLEDNEWAARKREEALNSALSDLDLSHPSADGLLVRKYFSVHILLVLAEATWTTDKSNIDIIKKAYDFCETAKSYAEEILILQPAVFIELGSYKSIEGDQHGDICVASALYTESRLFLDQVVEQFKSRKLEKTTLSAKNFLNYAILMRDWGNLLTEEKPVPEERRAEALHYLRQAVGYAQCSARIFRRLGSSNKYDLLKSICEAADSLEQLHVVTPKSDKAVRGKIRMRVLKYYNRAYIIVKNHYRSCHFSPDDSVLAQLIDRLPLLMTSFGTPTERVDKVRHNLQMVRDEAGKDADRNINLSSGSEVNTSSDAESSDEETFTGSTLSHISHSARSFLPHSDVPQVAQPIETGPEEAKEVSADGDVEEGASSSKKIRKYIE